MKRGYVVYRVDYVSGREEAIGCMLERRERERAKNLLALLAEARKLFGQDPPVSIRIELDQPNDCNELWRGPEGDGR